MKNKQLDGKWNKSQFLFLQQRVNVLFLPSVILVGKFRVNFPKTYIFGIIAFLVDLNEVRSRKTVSKTNKM